MDVILNQPLLALFSHVGGISEKTTITTSSTTSSFGEQKQLINICYATLYLTQLFASPIICINCLSTKVNHPDENLVAKSRKFFSNFAISINHFKILIKICEWKHDYCDCCLHNRPNNQDPYTGFFGVSVSKCK